MRKKPIYWTRNIEIYSNAERVDSSQKRSLLLGVVAISSHEKETIELSSWKASWTHMIERDHPCFALICRTHLCDSIRTIIADKIFPPPFALAPLV